MLFEIYKSRHERSNDPRRLGVRRNGPAAKSQGAQAIEPSGSASRAIAEYGLRANEKRRRGVHVDIVGERIVLDEFAARLDHVTHQLGEDVVGLVDLLDLHLQERARLGIERGLPELIGVHLAEAFVTLQRQSLATGL